MTSFKILVFVFLTCLLAGCITLGDLTQEIAKTEESVASIVTLIDQCPEVPSEALLVGQDLLEIKSEDRSALEVGVEILRVANGEAMAVSTAEPEIRAFINTLHFNPSLWEGELVALSDASADLAEQALAGDVVNLLFFDSAALESSEERIISRVKWKEAAETFAEVTAQKGWTSSFARTLGQLALKGRSSVETKMLQRRLLTSAYMVAYFRNGRIFSVDLEQQQLRDELLSELGEIVSDQALHDEVESVFSDFYESFLENACPDNSEQKCLILGGIGEQTFVTRAGKSYGFPGVSATISAGAEKKLSTNEIDGDAVIGDLVRVLGEAIGDSLSAVPGAPNSTLCEVLPERCGNDSDSPALQRVKDAGDRAEATSRYVASMAVRGGWLFALNNEALATSIETAIAVGARKVTEVAAWSNQRSGCLQGNSVGQYSKIRYKFVAGTL